MDRSIEQILEEMLELQAQTAFVQVSTQWRMLELELAKLRVAQPEAYDIVQDAWADDGWLVRPPWSQEDSDD